MRKLSAKQKQQLVGLLDWFFSSLDEDTGAKTVVRIPAQEAQDNSVEDLSDSDAPPTAEQHAQRMRQMAHPDASVTGHVPDGFVPTAATNGRPSGSGMKTDSAMVRKI